MTEKNEFYCVNTPIYVVGVVVKDGVIIDVPPIVKWGKGKRFVWFIGRVRNTYPTVQYELIRER